MIYSYAIILGMFTYHVQYKTKRKTKNIVYMARLLPPLPGGPEGLIGGGLVGTRAQYPSRQV